MTYRTNQIKSEWERLLEDTKGLVRAVGIDILSDKYKRKDNILVGRRYSIGDCCIVRRGFWANTDVTTALGETTVSKLCEYLNDAHISDNDIVLMRALQ